MSIQMNLVEALADPAVYPHSVKRVAAALDDLLSRA